MSSPHGVPLSPLSTSSKQGVTSPHNVASPIGITPSYQVMSASNPVSSTPQRIDVHDGNNSSSVIANGAVVRSPGGLPHSQSGITPTSGAELLKECIEWVENRRVSKTSHMLSPVISSNLHYSMVVPQRCGKLGHFSPSDEP